MIVLLLLLMVVMSRLFALFGENIKFADRKTRLQLPAKHKQTQITNDVIKLSLPQCWTVKQLGARCGSGPDRNLNWIQPNNLCDPKKGNFQALVLYNYLYYSFNSNGLYWRNITVQFLLYRVNEYDTYLYYILYSKLEAVNLYIGQLHLEIL